MLTWMPVGLTVELEGSSRESGRASVFWDSGCGVWGRPEFGVEGLGVLG